ncbi:TetR/AcrR family transcriptional regulator [Streptomyces sp. NBC_01198]|uniref:TetR/AcrR family transcriptional regulator n=1 Tax=Streptomyces sp. NBC_01198 TaxID=2903769 RepID=UPI002E0D1FED|nr:TetR/AcrR family transcriptional regulator [Streptomyces sp. NBC_01198]
MAAAGSRRVPRAEREQQMLDAAVATFARRGYRAASMDEIAEAAGVSKPLVYLYLSSKDALFTACIRREAAALTQAVRDAVEEGATPERQLWGGLLGFFEHTSAHPDGWTILYSQARTVGEPFAAEVAGLRSEIVDYVAGLIAAACGSQDVAGYAHALVGAAESLAGWAASSASPGLSGKDLAATLMNFAWSGLAALLPPEAVNPAPPAAPAS